MIRIVLLIFVCCSANIASSDLSHRIINGELSSPGQFPYAAFFYYTKGNVTRFCGGSLINDKWILTAAFCVQDAHQFIIYLGTTNLVQDDPNRIIMNSDSSITHPDYDSATLEHNIGLLALPSSVEFTEHIQPIGLSSEELKPNEEVVAVGWGTTNDGDTEASNNLYHASLVTIENSICQRIYSTQIKDTMVCTLSVSGVKGICRGDSGGPLVQNRDGNDVLVAVSGFYSGRGCEYGDPSGYAKVSNYVDWIRATSAANTLYVSTISLLLVFIIKI